MKFLKMQTQTYLIFSDELEVRTPLKVIRAESGLQNVHYDGHKELTSFIPVDFTVDYCNCF